MASPVATSPRPPLAGTVRVPSDLEELLGGPERTRRFLAKLALKLQPRRHRITAEFDPAGNGLAIHFNEREAL